ncbi:MAG: hypothetical protein AAB225_31475, partial [Acidobacteriota bacterium]
LEIGISADARAALRAFLEALGARRWPPRPWLERVAAFHTELKKALPPGHGAWHRPASMHAETGRQLPRC